MNLLIDPKGKLHSPTGWMPKSTCLGTPFPGSDSLRYSERIFDVMYNLNQTLASYEQELWH